MTLPAIPSSQLRLQHLVLCRALVESGTVSEAASMLHRTQPALTKMLQELESSLGVKLFERGRLGARPTAAGKAFFDRSGAMLNEWRILSEELEAIAKGERGILRVGATPLTTLTLMPQALGRLRKERPGLLVRFREATIHDLVLALDAGELDCVVGRFSGELLGTEAVGALRHERLYDQVLCIVSGTEHAMARRRRVTWKDLASQDWVLPPPELATRNIFNSSFIREGLLPPRPVFESSSFATSISFAHQLGVLAIVPLEAARIAQAHGLVRVLRTDLAAFSAPISIIQRRDAPPSESLSAFFDAVRAAVAENMD
ncbi:MAG: LysR family transcriptional regulator [Proteobacteria bacterium]|nr:LysR family transcriptional regulator [Pseudomonadota bacterium]